MLDVCFDEGDAGGGEVFVEVVVEGLQGGGGDGGDGCGDVAH